MFRDINKLYAIIGYHTPTTGKSAKVLGVTLAFQLGLSNDEIRILGRWRSLSTAQHYRNVEPSKLLKLSTAISFETASQPGLTGSCFFPAVLQSERADSSFSSAIWSGNTQTTAPSSTQPCTQSRSTARPNTGQTNGAQRTVVAMARPQAPPRAPPAPAARPLIQMWRHLGDDNYELVWY